MYSSISDRKMMRICIVILFATIQFITADEVTTKYGLLRAQSLTLQQDYCISYIAQIGHMPQSKSEAIYHSLQNDTAVNWCDYDLERDVTGKIVLLSENNCSLLIQARNVQDQNGVAVIFVESKMNFKEMNISTSEAVGINITISFLSVGHYRALIKLEAEKAIQFAVALDKFDYSLIGIWIISMFTIIVGSYWSGNVHYAIFLEENKRSSNSKELVDQPTQETNQQKYYEPSAISISVVNIFFFVCAMAAMLLLMYYFYSYIVYAIIGLFAMGTAISTYQCFEPLFSVNKVPNCRVLIPYKGTRWIVDLKYLVLIVLAIALSIAWIVTRKESYSWILQDILGIVFCINLLKTIRLPNFKICSMLLTLLFVYDIFFVFITPFFTSKGQSIMEKVATGGGSSDEMVPMLFRIPHLGHGPSTVCFVQVTSLGFGDVLIPGLFISFCYAFDLVTNKKKIYLISSSTGYGIGMLVTFLALILMDAAQPALLYLVPCTLLPVTFIALIKKDLSRMWKGLEATTKPKAVSSRVEEEDVEGNIPAASEESEHIAPEVSHSQAEGPDTHEPTAALDRNELLEK